MEASHCLQTLSNSCIIHGSKWFGWYYGEHGSCLLSISLYDECFIRSQNQELFSPAVCHPWTSHGKHVMSTVMNPPFMLYTFFPIDCCIPVNDRYIVAPEHYQNILNNIPVLFATVSSVTEMHGLWTVCCH